MKKILIGAVCLVLTVGFAAQDKKSKAQDATPTESTLIGTWKFKIGNSTGDVIFRKGGGAIWDGHTKVTGIWKQELNCILIQWDEVDGKTGCKTWEALTLPLKKEGSLGGNWCGQKVSATKAD